MPSPSGWEPFGPTRLASSRATSRRASRAASSSAAGLCLTDSELELVGPVADALAALAGEGVQSLLLEGGPTLATAFLEADLVDKLLVFVAPTLAGAGRGSSSRSPAAALLHPRCGRSGTTFLEAYLGEP